MEQIEHNPDVLNCIANLSNDEVFTPPVIVNQMLDLLPQWLFSDPNSTFLDPFTKTAVFLREIVKRLDKGLEAIIPDRQVRIDHILHKQVFGMAITELTSLLSRRTLYCSKFANGEHSISHFDTPEGNIWYQQMKHTWVNGKCKFCGAAQSVYDRGNEAEQYAYPFIHLTDLKSIYNMKFSVICGNPPYMLKDGGSGASSSPIYNKFVDAAIKLSPDYITMITPSRWFAGGKGLDAFRIERMADERYSHMVNYSNGKDCFPSSSTGSVNYFLWDKNHKGSCMFTSVHNNSSNTVMRPLNEFEVVIGNNLAVNIIHKVKSHKEELFSAILSSRNPFGLSTNQRGSKSFNDYLLVSSDGDGFIPSSLVTNGKDIADAYKVMITRVMCEHAGEPAKNGKFKVLATLRILKPKEICTDSYITAGRFATLVEAQNVERYLKTKFVRFLILQAASSINLSRDTYCFVPVQDFNINWTDEQLFDKYGLSLDERTIIDDLIIPIDD